MWSWGCLVLTHSSLMATSSRVCRLVPNQCSVKDAFTDWLNIDVYYSHTHSPITSSQQILTCRCIATYIIRRYKKGGYFTCSNTLGNHSIPNLHSTHAQSRTLRDVNTSGVIICEHNFATHITWQTTLTGHARYTTISCTYTRWDAYHNNIDIVSVGMLTLAFRVTNWQPMLHYHDMNRWAHTNACVHTHHTHAHTHTHTHTHTHYRLLASKCSCDKTRWPDKVKCIMSDRMLRSRVYTCTLVWIRGRHHWYM